MEADSGRGGRKEAVFCGLSCGSQVTSENEKLYCNFNI